MGGLIPAEILNALFIGSVVLIITAHGLGKSIK